MTPNDKITAPRRIENYMPSDDTDTPVLVPLGVLNQIRKERNTSELSPEAPESPEQAAMREPPSPPIKKQKHKHKQRQGVPVFDPDAVARILDATEQGRRDEKVRMLQVLEDAARNNGYREVLHPKPGFLGQLETELLAAFPNFAPVVRRLIPDLALQGARASDSFRMAPLLLHGAPGIGKTTFASTLAKRLGVDWDVISAGGAQGAFEIVGSSSHWSTAHPGRVAQLLARSRYASSILVVDEVDKISGSSQSPVLPALLDLLEEQSAKRFRDTSLELVCDASRLIILATANDIDCVPAPLRSRMQEIAIAMPTVAERRAIAEGMCQTLLRPMHADARPTLDPQVLDRLAAAPIDLREVQRRLAQAVGRAVLAQRTRLSVGDLPSEDEDEGPPRMGFV
ncbi:MAG: AAA family ATPase [Gammaproteobacteria bacterium]|nr:AAA family ATPase [Gammaproteobacteria bacterium]